MGYACQMRTGLGFANISTEGAIKFLKELEKDEIIKLSGKDIFILDFEKLEDVAKKR